jgi:hypothetical protein
LNSELPSWVPNWSRETRSSHGRTSSQVRRNERDKFQADVRVIQGESTCRKIKMKVILVGEVEEISKMWLRKASGCNRLEYAPSWYLSERNALALLHTTWRIFGWEPALLKPKDSGALESGLSEEERVSDSWTKRDWKLVDADLMKHVSDPAFITMGGLTRGY